MYISLRICVYILVPLTFICGNTMLTKIIEEETFCLPVLYYALKSSDCV